MFQNNISETGFCLFLQVEPTQLGPINRIQSPKRCVLKHKQDDDLDKKRTVNDVQKHNNVLMYHHHKLLDLMNTVDFLI
jgi:hypothetical protein